ncbi:autoinducer 2 ABC transporter ATP-binding protein LsrA [Pantoea cypripedii]|uniref:autoinducer 2 ABC transporter ATP-binding protein LsrA n=1 Tax=Pantoea cypripedii TaxID=55209 RepID=UPI001AE7E985|nr:autoinducer 2 ABC transporter ATP-binding protein LsrA [Pantoea cypripedii]MBP2198470.1 AI-2 transport system ATP-binding protein [Pantoea cypripedii]
MVQDQINRQSSLLLHIAAVCKAFSGVPVLRGIDFQLYAGQIHALLGGNGAGKSTLMKIIAGIEQPDSGTLTLAHQPLTLMTPAKAHQCGIYLVPQEPLLFPSLTVRENILFRLPRAQADNQKLQTLLSQMGSALPLDALAGTLAVADQQQVEILRGLMRDARVVIFDEPTASLTPVETDRLFRLVRQLAGQGVGVVFISHKLPEIRALAHQVSVMRDGCVVLQGSIDALDDDALVAAMMPPERQAPLSAEQQLWLQAGNLPAEQKGQVLLQVDELSGEGFRQISLQVKAGEILGLAGIVGAGRTELAETLYGLRPASSGTARLQQQNLLSLPTAARLRAGLVYLPEDRQTSGLYPDAPLAWNVTALTLPRRSWWLRPQQERAVLTRYQRALGIKFSHNDQLARTLSGGNQQKLLLANCLEATPKVLIVDEPTRGVDVAARADIYQLLRSVVAQQIGLIIISSDLDEVALLADRVVVMHQGGLVGELSGAAVSAENIIQLAWGRSAQAAGEY